VFTTPEIKSEINSEHLAVKRAKRSKKSGQRYRKTHLRRGWRGYNHGTAMITLCRSQ